MKDWVKSSFAFFQKYIDSFSGLTPEQMQNFHIKKEHSLRVAEYSGRLGKLLNLSEEDWKVAYLSGLFHDIGRFPQLIEFNTFNDLISVDHADYSVKVLQKKKYLNFLDEQSQELVYFSIQFHNKFRLPSKGTEHEIMHARLLRDADKLDILKVLTDYYSTHRKKNHTLTWELPQGLEVSPAVAKEVLAGKLVSKNSVRNEMDVKIMQLSWVYDLNFKSSFKLIFEKRLLEKIFDSLPKNDLILDIYRRVNVFAENKILE